jgi:hypothetical protein
MVIKQSSGLVYGGVEWLGPLISSQLERRTSGGNPWIGTTFVDISVVNQCCHPPPDACHMYTERQQLNLSVSVNFMNSSFERRCNERGGGGHMSQGTRPSNLCESRRFVLAAHGLSY